MRNVAFLIIVLTCCEAKYVPEDGVYAVTETMPEYAEGMTALNSYVNQAVANTDIEGNGSVFVSFIVTTEGKIGKMTVLNGVNENLDQEALRILKEAPGKWNPGTEEGQPVDVKMVYPVRF